MYICSGDCFPDENDVISAAMRIETFSVEDPLDRSDFAFASRKLQEDR
jgi:hypothetical protein